MFPDKKCQKPEAYNAALMLDMCKYLSRVDNICCYPLFLLLGCFSLVASRGPQRASTCSGVGSHGCTKDQVSFSGIKGG